MSGPLTSARAAPRPASPADDADSRAWLSALGSAGPTREAAAARLHALLLRAARIEVRRRARAHPHLRGGDLDDLAFQAADDALVSILARLETFRGDSRFTTWAYKFALLEAAVKVRKRAWQGREIPLEAPEWARVADPGSRPHEAAERGELMAAVREGIAVALTPHQRDVLIALAVNGAPIDVLAERLGTSRGALYKTLHDARKKLRAHLEESGLSVQRWLEEQ